MSRIFFVGGNWKCNGNKTSINSLVKELNEEKFQANVEIIVAPPTIYLNQVSSIVKPEIKVSAQNCHYEGKGAFTGEISADMIKDVGLEWVILGHSERRIIFGELDEVVGKKVGYALGVGLKVIVCIGEKLEERESGTTDVVLFRQLNCVSEHIKDWKNVVIAYEPVWAIGTGKTATPDIAQTTHLSIRNWLRSNVSNDVANKTRIIYGGSVKGTNSADLARMPDIDGFLVGGASLISSEFTTIVNSVTAKP